MSSSQPSNHIFVDFENIQMGPDEIELVGKQGFQFVILVGNEQRQLTTYLVERVQDNQASARFVFMSETGRNALDFTLAYHLGAVAHANANGFFHVISRDKDYDPMIKHLKNKNLKIYRHDDFTLLHHLSEKFQTVRGAMNSPKLLPSEVVVKSTQPDGKFDELLLRAVKHLGSKETLPKKKKGLTNVLSSHLNLEVNSTILQQVIMGLARKGIISLQGEVVSDLRRLAKG